MNARERALLADVEQLDARYHVLITEQDRVPKTGPAHFPLDTRPTACRSIRDVRLRLKDERPTVASGEAFTGAGDSGSDPLRVAQSTTGHGVPSSLPLSPNGPESHGRHRR